MTHRYSSYLIIQRVVYTLHQSKLEYICLFMEETKKVFFGTYLALPYLNWIDEFYLYSSWSGENFLMDSINLTISEINPSENKGRTFVQSSFLTNQWSPFWHLPSVIGYKWDSGQMCVICSQRNYYSLISRSENYVARWLIRGWLIGNELLYHACCYARFKPNF